jgi:hypothetical protein
MEKTVDKETKKVHLFMDSEHRRAAGRNAQTRAG